MANAGIEVELDYNGDHLSGYVLSSEPSGTGLVKILTLAGVLVRHVDRITLINQQGRDYVQAWRDKQAGAR